MHGTLAVPVVGAHVTTWGRTEAEEISHHQCLFDWLDFVTVFLRESTICKVNTSFSFFFLNWFVTVF